MFEDLQTMFAKLEKLKKDHDIRVVVFTAKGKHFSAGLDLKEAPENFDVGFVINEVFCIQRWSQKINKDL